MEAKIHIGGYNKIKERTLGDYGDGMRLSCSCEGWGQVRNMLRGGKKKGSQKSPRAWGDVQIKRMACMLTFSLFSLLAFSTVMYLVNFINWLFPD